MNAVKRDFQVTEYWQACLSTALLGTDRRLPAAPLGNDEVATVLQGLNWEEPASALLGAVSAITQYQAVGNPVNQQNTLESESTTATLAAINPCEPDTIPCCHARIARHLGIVIADYTEVAEELLELIAAAGQRVPPKWLPKLLRFGEKRSFLQPLIVPVLGNRGRWLAAQNPNWQYGCAISSDDATENETETTAKLLQQWEAGTKRDRIFAFKQLRQIDPSMAREILAETWKGETWRDREAFITAMTPQLSLEDEPFLENTLTDRANSVRTYAADLLATLNNSQLCQRMSEQIQQFIQIKGTNIEVTLPKTYEQNWKQDGIVKKSNNGEGEKAGWLRQMLSKVPLSTWDTAPEAIAKAAAKHEWREALTNGWALAIHRQRAQPNATEWALAWLRQFGAYDLDETILQDLLLLLPIQKREIYLRSQLPKDTNDQNLSHWLKLVAQKQQRWNFDFSQLILSQLIKLLKRKPKYGDLFSPPITIALSLHPGIAKEASIKIETLLQTQYPTKAWQKFLDRFLEILTLRWEIYQAFANSS